MKGQPGQGRRKVSVNESDTSATTGPRDTTREVTHDSTVDTYTDTDATTPRLASLNIFKARQILAHGKRSFSHIPIAVSKIYFKSNSDNLTFALSQDAYKS